jgi:hypothetical protein
MNCKVLNTHKRLTGKKMNLYYDKSKYKNIILKEYASQQMIFILDNYNNWSFVEDYSGMRGWIQRSKLKIPTHLYLVTKCQLETLNSIKIAKNTKLLLITGKEIKNNIILECLIKGSFQKIILNKEDAKEKLW